MKKAPFKDTPRIEWKNGAWYYRPRAHEREQFGVAWYRIGINEHEVYEFLASRARQIYSRIDTMGRALDRYLAEVVLHKAFKTQESNRTSITRLKKVFAQHTPLDLEFADFIEYRDAVGERSGKKAANSDLEVVSHLYTKLIEWGAIQNRDHPLRGLKYKFPREPRDRYVSHGEVTDLHDDAGAFFKLWIPFKLKCSLDQITMVSIHLRKDVTEEGIYYRRRKLKRHDTGRQGKLKLIVWDEELRVLVGRMIALRARKPNREYLFCNARGRQYVCKNGTAQPVRNAWGRLKRKAGITDYTEHDLRAKSLSDEEELSVAIHRGDHSQGNTTTRVYRRKAEKVLPLSLAGAELAHLLGDDHDAHVAEHYLRTVIQTEKA